MILFARGDRQTKALRENCTPRAPFWGCDVTEKECEVAYKVADETYDEIMALWLRAKESRPLTEEQIEYIADYMREHVRFRS